MYNRRPPYENELYHYGVLGMKWGVRRYQNPDGTLTAEGRKRYLNSDGTLTKEGLREYWRGRGGRKNYILNSEIDYMEEYDKTSEGKILRKRLSKASNAYFNSHSLSKNEERRLENEYSKIEREYLNKSGKFVASKLLDEFGQEEFDRYVNYGSGSWMDVYNRHEDTVEAFINGFVRTHIA